jgi:uncharacterized SAM-binding protein YcdF (DUF218 family)
VRAQAEEWGIGLAVGAAAALLADDLGLHGVVSYWGPRAPVVILASVLGAFLWRTRLRRLVAASALAVGVLWLVVAFTPLTRVLAHGLVRRDELREADAIVVLASSIQKDGELTAVAMSRLLHGLELVGARRSRRLVITRIEPPFPSYEGAVRALLAGFKLETALFVLGPVHNTRDEAAAVKRLFDERGLERLILVTSPTHTRRAAAAFEKKGLVVMASPSVETWFDLQSLDTTDDRLRGFSSVVHERLGLLVYRRRGDLR